MVMYMYACMYAGVSDPKETKRPKNKRKFKKKKRKIKYGIRNE